MLNNVAILPDAFNNYIEELSLTPEDFSLTASVSQNWVEMYHSGPSFIVDSIPASLNNSTKTVKDFDVSNISSVCVHSMINKRPFETAGTSSLLPSSRKIFLCSSRIGDLDDDDFSTLRRRKRNVSVVKNSILNLRRKNKLFKQKNRRLEKKVNSLLDIVNELKNKCMISENAAFNLKVCCVCWAIQIF